MKRAGGKNSWALFLLMLAGIVLGGFIGTLTADMPGFAWLNYGQIGRASCRERVCQYV